jgi:uncharacterized membrane protein
MSKSWSGHGFSRGAMALGGVGLALGVARVLRARAKRDRVALGAVRVSKTVTVNRPIEEVYAFWRDLENLPRFMTHLESVQVRGGQSHWRAKAPAGLSVEWDATLVEERPNERLVWQSAADADVPNAGTIRFVEAPGARGTEVHVDLHYDVPGGKVGAAFAKLFGEEPSQQIQSDLRRFKQVMETGEVLHSDASIHRGAHPAQPAKRERSVPKPRLGASDSRKEPRSEVQR